MKAISELAELWGGLRRGSIWAPGLHVHSLASLKQLEWARLECKEEYQEKNQAGTHGCRISSVDTLVNTWKHAHKQSELLGGGWLFVAGVAGVHASGSHRQTTIYGELIKKWQRESEVGFCTNTSGIAISLRSASVFKFTFMSFEAGFKSVRYKSNRGQCSVKKPRLQYVLTFPENIL